MPLSLVSGSYFYIWHLDQLNPHDCLLPDEGWSFDGLHTPGPRDGPRWPVITVILLAPGTLLAFNHSRSTARWRGTSRQ